MAFLSSWSVNFSPAMFMVLNQSNFSLSWIISFLLGLSLFTFLFWFLSSNSIKFKFLKQLLILIPLLILIATYLNNRTNGNLLLRYQGETKGTLVGSKEKGINTLTTNRFNILMGDIQTFLNHPLIGVETGKSKEYRIDSQHQYSHVEFSRLLAEHGLIGLIISLIWLVDLFKIENKILRTLYIIGFLTTMHGAMRTTLPFIFMLVANIQIGNPKSSKSS
jgi:hypothetical protein